MENELNNFQLNKLIKSLDWYRLDNLKRVNNVDMSEEFCTCLNEQLTAYFEEHTNIKVNKYISITVPWNTPRSPPQFIFEKGDVSKFSNDLMIAGYNQNNVTVAWKSRSGRIYDTADTDIDCEDIIFWFENFDPLLYRQQLYPKPKLPFRMKKPSYELELLRLQMQMEIELHFRAEYLPQAAEIEKGIYDFSEAFNMRSVDRDREDGVVHNIYGSITDNVLTLTIDTGSAGPVFLKQFLEYLSNLKAFEKVVIG